MLAYWTRGLFCFAFSVGSSQNGASPCVSYTLLIVPKILLMRTECCNELYDASK